MATNTSSSSPRVGMVGLGAMGQGIALNLVSHVAVGGLPGPLLVWNRTASKADEAVAAGAQFAGGGVGEIARECDITFCMVFDDASLLDTLHAFLQGPPRPGACFVAMPTVHPDTTREASRLAAAAGISYLACPVFGRPDAARAKKLVCVVAGPTEAKARVRPFLDAIGHKVLDQGEDPASASVLKLVGNYMIVGIVELLSEAMTLGEKTGLPKSDFLALIDMFFPVPVFRGYAGRIAAQEFSTKGGIEGFTVDGGIKDSSLARRLASENGMRTPVLDVALEHLQRQKAKGIPDLDFASLSQIIRQDAGLE